MTLPAADELRAWRARPPCIVVVEDARDMAEAIRLTLTSEGFDVRLAHDGHIGLELARSAAPDVVLLDIDLPDIDSWEVCRHVRTFSDAYVVMVTVHADEFDRVPGLSSGADDYIHQAVRAPRARGRIRAMLRRPRRRGGARAPPTSDTAVNVAPGMSVRASRASSSSASAWGSELPCSP